MANFREDVQYFYCPDYKKYVKCDKGVFYSLEKNGKIKKNDFYLDILIGDIWVEDITEEEFNAQLA